MQSIPWASFRGLHDASILLLTNNHILVMHISPGKRAYRIGCRTSNRTSRKPVYYLCLSRSVLHRTWLFSHCYRDDGCKFAPFLSIDDGFGTYLFKSHHVCAGFMP